MRKYFFIPFIFLSLTSQILPQSWFPLEIGNRWDYLIHIDAGSMGESYDTLSIEIVEKQILSNGLEYFVFSKPFPFWYSYFPTHIREENNEIFIFDIEDSIDCFAFRFDIPEDSIYINCLSLPIYIYSIDTLYTLGFPDFHQDQGVNFGSTSIDFSYNFGIYHHFFNLIAEHNYDLQGCIISGITYGDLLVSKENDVEVPNNFSLSQNYPNPFNPSTTISYSVPEIEFVTLKVYDVLGNEVATLVNEEKPVGTYEITWYAENLPSGIYFYRLTAGSFVETKKMVLMK